ncbi:putative alcohol dehydrogenase [Hypoxylon sp. FL1284]|nr:putative alcohol dehydrogenase [Hypoxylon sp. FL1284]
MARQWTLEGQTGLDSLEYHENVKVPSAELGPHEVLVKLHAASLNYRDLIHMMGTKFGQIKPSVVPGCDGAGVVEAIGPSVQDFKPGDRVVTHVSPAVAEDRGDDALPNIPDASLMLGQGQDGTLRSEGVFSEKALAHAPRSLGWLSAATMTCTFLTAWNVLFGLKGQEPRPGAWVLVQGTGGASVAVLQLAVAAGFNVVATTSSEDRAARLRALGAKHTVNYRTNPAGWGQEARSFTPEGKGFDSIVEIGGDQSLSQSLVAVKPDGIITLVGVVGDEVQPVPMFGAFAKTCVVRGVLAGSRDQLNDVIRFVDEKGVKPALDDVVFELADAKDAYKRMVEKKHFAKILIRIDHPEI